MSIPQCDEETGEQILALFYQGGFEKRQRLMCGDGDTNLGFADAELGAFVQAGSQDSFFADVGAVGGSQVTQENRIFFYFYGAMQPGDLGIVDFDIGSAAQSPNGDQRDGHIAFDSA